jgi:hypothetical protein
MLGKLGYFLAGMLVAFLLDPTSGDERRKQLNKRLAPLRQRLMAARRGDAEGAGLPAPMTEMVHHASDAASRLHDQIGSETSMVADKARTAAQHATQSVKEQAQKLKNQAPAPAEMETPVTPGDVAPTNQFDPIPEGDPDEAHPGETINDPTLVARIESELYRDDAIPKGKLNIDAVHGVVTVRGTVTGDIAGEVLERTRAVEGVREVVDKLHRD